MFDFGDPGEEQRIYATAILPAPLRGLECYLDGQRRAIVAGKFYRTGDMNIAIAAAVNLNDDRTIFDWGAYIFAKEGDLAYGEMYYEACKDGVKLHTDEAAKWFPALPIDKYRR